MVSSISSKSPVSMALDVPRDILTLIFGRFLDDASFISVQLTCRKFQSVCKDLQKKKIRIIPFKNRSDFYQYAARIGSLSLLVWAQQERGMCQKKGIPWDKHICNAAAEGGHLELLKNLRKNNCPWDAMTCAYAARSGNLEVLKWGRENGCPWDKWTCAYAAGEGHLDVLKWARENGCHWSKTTCTSAAAGGHLEVLKWARENGCPWDRSTLFCATRGFHTKVVEWAIENGCSW